MKIPLTLLLLALLPLPAAAVTRTWTGGGADDNFNNPANWNPSGAPANGDDLVFPSGIPQTTVNNNLTGRTFGSLTIQKALTISGNDMTLAGGISCVPAGIGGAVVIEPGITLGASQSFTSGGGTVSSLTFGGNVTFGTHVLTLAGARAVTFNGLTGSSSASSGFIKNGTGLLRFGPASIFLLPRAYPHSAGTLDIDGLFNPAVNMTGGTLTGEGQLLGGLDASDGDIIPDDDGLDVSSGATLRGTVNLRVNLLAPAQASGLECSGNVTIQDAATLELVSSYTPLRGDGFLVLTKSTASPITGAFSNAAQGADLPAGASTSLVRVSYTGGNGNDLFLTTSSTRRIWDGDATLNDNWDEPDNWSSNRAPLAGDTLVFPSGIGSTDRGMDNNFASGTGFREIIVQGDDFTIRGNLFRLSHGLTMVESVRMNLDTDLALLEDQTFRMGTNSVLHLDALDKIQTIGRTLALEAVPPRAANFETYPAIDGTISGPGGVTLTPDHGFALTAANDYTGPTIVGAGAALRVTKETALGSSGGATTIASGGALLIDGVAAVFTVHEPLFFHSGATLRCHNEGIVSNGTAVLAGPIGLVEGPANLDALDANPLRIEGGVSGAGSLNLMHTTEIKGGSSNSYTGGTTVNGDLVLEKAAAGIIAIPGPVCEVREPVNGTSPNSMETRQDEQIADDCDVILRENSTLRIGNVTPRTETIKSLTFDGVNPGVLIANGGRLNLRGSITCLPDTGGQLCRIGALSDNDNTTLNLEGTPNVISIQGNFNGAFNAFRISTAMTRTGSASVRKTGVGLLRITGQGSVPFEIQDGLVAFENAAGGSAVTLNGNGAVVTGAGRCGAITATANGGKILPDHSFTTEPQPAVLSCGSVTLNAASTLQMRVRTFQTGTGFSQLSVAGGVNLGGAVLHLVHLPEFNVTAGQSIFPLLNDGTDSIIGTFAGLPQGAFIPIPAATGGGGWIISYTGGTGNDVALTRAAAPAGRPSLTSVNFSRGTGPNDQDQVTLGGSGAVGFPYTLEASSDLSAWTALQPVTPGAGGAVGVTINQAPGLRTRFFRLRE